jgi:hypothetical protein
MNMPLSAGTENVSSLILEFATAPEIDARYSVDAAANSGQAAQPRFYSLNFVYGHS